jgi:hypothetical protein
MVLFVSIFSEDVLDPLDADGGGDDTGAGDDTGSSDTGGEDTPLVTDGS